MINAPYIYNLMGISCPFFRKKQRTPETSGTSVTRRLLVTSH